MLDETIRLNGEPYILARQKDKDGKVQGRSWQEILTPLTTKKSERPDVQAGPSPDEMIILYDDWSEGISGDLEGVVGGIHYTQNAHGLVPGAIYPTPPPDTYEPTDAQGVDPVEIIIFHGELFTVNGRYMYKFANGTVTTDRDFGAGIYATTAVVFNDSIVVGFGGSTNKIQVRDSAGSWTTASDAVYADFFAMVEDRLWRATATNEVSNIGPTDNPKTLTNWSAGISVGDDDLAITDLNGYGERLAVSKVNGLFLGDDSAVFPNVLPQIESVHDPRNGRSTFVKGATVFYPHANGLIKYFLGNAEEVGVQKVFPSAQPADSLPGTRITSMTMEGNNIWAASEANGYPRARPTGFLKTTDIGVNYTDLLANVIDGTQGTVSAIGALDTVANGDWLHIGYSSKFYGVIWDLTNPNTNSATMTVEYWNGSAWTALDNANGLSDKTVLFSTGDPLTPGAASLRRSGMTMWKGVGALSSTWTASTINGTLAFWIRVSFSAALDATVSVGEIWVMTETPSVTVWRGRPGVQGDARYDSVVWEPFGYVQNMIFPGAILFTQDQYPHNRREQLVVSSRNYMAFFHMPISAPEQQPQRLASQGFAILPKHDGGMPEVLKQFMYIDVHGRGVTSGRTINVQYRLDDATAWATAQAAITSLPTRIALSTSASDISAYRIQLKVSFNSWTDDALLMPHITELGIIFRPRFTMKRMFQFSVEVEDGQILPTGGRMIPPDKQLTNLESLVGYSPIVLYDPTRRQYDVTIASVQVSEIDQHMKEKPRIVVQVTAHQV